MLFERLKIPGLAQQSYFLECGNGAAIVVDPRRDIDAYIELARDNELGIACILETHRQEDFEYGSLALAQATGARIVTGKHELFGRSDMQLADGAELTVGTTLVRLLETPGHTPESVCYAVYPEQTRPRCWGVFTGDTLFAGATGRTDLSDPAKTAASAGLLFDSVHAKLASLGDGTLVFAAHGPGSACGSNIAGRNETTIGIEKATNPVFIKGRAEFIQLKCREHIPRPPYFSMMERFNLGGGRPLSGPPRTRLLPPSQFQQEMTGLLVVDVRSPDAYAAGHIAGSYNIWLAGLPSFIGWLADERTNVGLVLGSPEELSFAELALVRVGLDWPAAALSGGIAAWREQGLSLSESGTIGARESHERYSRNSIRILDVRDQSEWDEGHIPGALHIYVGHLRDSIPELPKDDPIVVHCSVGNRAGLAASMLESAGFVCVYNMLGGMKAWKSLNLPVETVGHGCSQD